MTKAGEKNRLAGDRQIQNVVNTVRELLEETKENRLTDEYENSPAGLVNRRSSAQQMNEGWLSYCRHFYQYMLISLTTYLSIYTTLTNN